MKHTDFYNQYQEIDSIDRKELITAVKAHGGEYIFPTISRPIILGSFKHLETSNYYVTKVTISNGNLTIYGRPTEYWDGYDDEIVYIEFGQIGYITDMIPETDKIKDVSGTAGDKVGYIWTQDAIINLQYITMYGEAYLTEVGPAGECWDRRFKRYQRMAIEFSTDEPDWDKSDVDYETAIEAFCKRELGF